MGEKMALILQLLLTKVQLQTLLSIILQELLFVHTEAIHSPFLLPTISSPRLLLLLAQATVVMRLPLM